jgi:hypothetical protein
MDDCADLDWQKVPKRKPVCNHEAWSKPQCSRFCGFFFCFWCCLLFADYVFWLAFFTVWMALGVDRLVLCVTSSTYELEGSADCQDKKAASGDGKLHSDIRAWVVRKIVSWTFSHSADVVLCGFWIRGLLVVLVREECPSMVEIDWELCIFVAP